MARARRDAETGRVLLALHREEAEMVMALVRAVGGDRYITTRGFSQGIEDALNACGINGLYCDKYLDGCGVLAAAKVSGL